MTFDLQGPGLVISGNINQNRYWGPHCRLTGGRRINKPGTSSLRVARKAVEIRRDTYTMGGKDISTSSPGRTWKSQSGTEWLVFSVHSKQDGRKKASQRPTGQSYARGPCEAVTKRPHLFEFYCLRRVVKCQTRPDKSGVPMGLRVKVPSRRPIKYNCAISKFYQSRYIIKIL